VSGIRLMPRRGIQNGAFFFIWKAKVADSRIEAVLGCTGSLDGVRARRCTTAALKHVSKTRLASPGIPPRSRFGTRGHRDACMSERGGGGGRVQQRSVNMGPSHLP
jgi:hypothetical protein